MTNSAYASVNGLDLYYEIHGEGDPLILLHGGLGTIDMLFAPLLPLLSQNRQVIAVELQAHGHTADIDRPLSYEAMADDIAALITCLGLDRADVMGFSLGGGVALQTAIRHPNLVRKLVTVSTAFTRQGWFPEVLAGMGSITAEFAAQMVGSPLHEFYTRVAPRPDDWTRLAVKTADLLRQDYDWSAAVAALKLPVLIVSGDADSVIPMHSLEMFSLLGGGKSDGMMGGMPGSRLAILPATTHFTILSPALADIVTPFLNA